MSLSIDSARAIRSALQQRTLIEAIHSAASVDETDWIEWKSSLNLTVPEGRFAVARQILAFGNRNPVTAATQFEGTAYVVVGVEPGAMPGMPSYDQSDLTRPINAYVGEDGPVWSVANVGINDRNFLIFTIEAPRFGDRIFALRKEYNPHTAQKSQIFPAGTIFVRNGTITAPATPAQIRVLEDRLLGGTQPPQIVANVRWAGEQIPVVGRLDTSPEAIEAAVAVERERLAIQVARAEAAGRASGSLNRMIANSYIGAQTLDGYQRDVNEYLADLPEALPDALRTSVIESIHCKAGIVAENPTDQTLQGARLVVNLPTGIEVHREPVGLGLPNLPAPIGTSTFGHTLSDSASYLGFATPVPEAGVISATREGSVVAFQLGDLHPFSSVAVGYDITLISTQQAPLTEEIVARWQVTASNRSGTVTGTLPPLRIASGQLTPADLLQSRL